MNPARVTSNRLGARSAAALIALSILAALLGAPLALAQRPATPSEGAGRCGVCHPAERVLFEKSRHAQEDVRCVSCHGGDDRTLTQSAAHGAGFRGRPSRQDIPKLCASCHASEERMRAYNLPVDQYALYQTSGHGRRLAQGDTRVAVCSDCHGAHDILPPGDPASRVFRVNIPKTCGACHGDSTLMKPRGRRDAFAEYMSSVHAHELFDQGNLRAPTCVSCHGVHGAAPPEVGDVDKVCGQCHTAERRYFTAGPHRHGMIDQGLPECASCHGDHAIAAARPERLESLCATCHGVGSQQEGLGKKLLTDYRNATREVEKADALIAKADQVPLQTEDYKARLEEARTYLREALPAAHSLQEETVAGFTARARSVGAEIEHEIYAKLGNLRVRKFVLILFWFYVLLTLVVLRRFRNRGARAD
jgi:predicted CXXCH cytochrome family protein